MHKRYRLKNSKIFNIVYRKGNSVSNKFLVLMWIKNKENFIKVGFTVSKKIGNSVVRNKVRRRLREAFRAIIPNTETGYTYVLLARSPIRGANYSQISNSVIELMNKSGHFIMKGTENENNS